MFLTKTAFLVSLIHAHVRLIARGQVALPGGGYLGDCIDIADVGLVVDVSGSIEGNGQFPGKFDEYVKPFIMATVRGLRVAPGKVQVGMVSFGDDATLEFPLSSNLDQIIRTIELFDYKSRSKNTNTSGGINLMRTQLLSPRDPNYRPRAAHIAIVITDGISTFDHDLTIPSAMAAQNLGIIMLAVGVTKELNLEELVAIASPLTPFDIASLQNGLKNGVFTPSGTVAYVPDITDLIDVVKQLVAHFKKTVCVGTDNCPSGDMADWCRTASKDIICSNLTTQMICCVTCVRILPPDCKSGDRGDWCSTVSQSSCSNQTIQAACCLTCGTTKTGPAVCNDYADVAFLVDVSGSIGKDRNDPGYFDRQIKPFLKSIVRRLNVGPGKIQAALVTFGNYAYTQFTLTSDVNEIMRGIDNTVYPPHGENTNTSGGIYVMRTQILGRNSPNFRPNASHLCIIVTDGQSTWDHEKTVPYARDAKNQGIVIFSIGATDSIDLLELSAIASNLEGFNFSAIQDAKKHNVPGISGSVAYSPTIENLNGIANEVTNYLSRTDCTGILGDVVGSCQNSADFCTSIQPDQCSNQAIAHICCTFCRQHQITNPTVINCWNNADWCESLFPGQCYDPQTERTCCKFCREHLTSDKSCRYGDQNSWCATQFCWDKTGNCCRTCP